jgi:glycerol-3-phosphate dehydrogenase
MADFDLAIIGGGINGATIARDAAGRGLRVLLVEQGDIGSGTSSTSTKLIHGGLRYLEHGAFSLVHEGLRERAILLRMAPHIVWPARFVLPHNVQRPAWQLQLGLFIYDILAGFNLLPRASRLDLSTDPAGTPLQPRFKTAFEYSDCCVDDARLVLMNVVDAAEHGADIRPRTKFEKAERKNGAWNITLSTGTVTAKGLVNAAGPWIEGVNTGMPAEIAGSHVKLVKGSHIVVKKLFDHNKAYIFQNTDGRIVFAIPYQHDFTLIGTTEYNFTGDPASAAASDEEIFYLCQLGSDYFKKTVAPSDVIWSFAGVRALIDNRSLKAKDLSRDYVLALDGGYGRAPLLSVYGGKLTAARHLAEEAMLRLFPYFETMKKAWTAMAPLPGGDFPWYETDKMLARAKKRWPFLNDNLAMRLMRSYGTRMDRILGDAKRMEDLGAIIGGDLTEHEVCYMMQHEWAKTVDDVLWRRSKLGLVLTRAEQDKLKTYMGGKA